MPFEILQMPAMSDPSIAAVAVLTTVMVRSVPLCG